MEYPSLLTTLGGMQITNAADWENWRRPEIMDLLSTYIYGKRPAAAEIGLHTTGKIVEEIDQMNGYAVNFRKVEITAGGYTFPVYGYLPAKTEKPVPAFIFIMHEYFEKHSDLLHEPNHPNLPIPDITARGYAVYVMPTRFIYLDQDHHIDYRDGVFNHFCDRELRREDDWATISAWSWGASRILDYLESVDAVDATQVAVVGHSRSGKTALWCGATDQRVAMAVSNASGCSGAAMHRGKKEGAEMIRDINCTDWFCGNYRKYNDNDDKLPCDQHMLIAAMAPRLCYVESCSEDDWACPYAERLSCRLAGEAYALYDMPGVILPDEPVEADTPYHEGSVGYHLKTGKHCISAYDWTQYMDFWEKKRAVK